MEISIGQAILIFGLIQLLIKIIHIAAERAFFNRRIIVDKELVEIQRHQIFKADMRLNQQVANNGE